jgi:hypothetical protein
MWAYTFNEKDHDGVTSGAKASWRPVFDPGSNPATELIGASKFDKPSGTHDKSVMEHQLAADESGRNLTGRARPPTRQRQQKQVRTQMKTTK